jgi:hypothetical protein
MADTYSEKVAPTTPLSRKSQLYEKCNRRLSMILSLSLHISPHIPPSLSTFIRSPHVHKNICHSVIQWHCWVLIKRLQGHHRLLKNDWFLWLPSVKVTTEFMTVHAELSFTGVNSKMKWQISRHRGRRSRICFRTQNRIIRGIIDEKKPYSPGTLQL